MIDMEGLLVVDVRGEICPGPLLATQQALKQANPGQNIAVLTDFQPAVMMVTTVAVKEGWDINCTLVDQGEWRLILAKSSLARN